MEGEKEMEFSEFDIEGKGVEGAAEKYAENSQRAWGCTRL